MHFFDFVFVSSPKNEPIKTSNKKPSKTLLQLLALCEKGELPPLMAFLKAHPTIPLSANQEKAFRTACEYGHLPLAKILLAYKPDIDIGAQENYAFRYAYANGHWETAHWVWVQQQQRRITNKPQIQINDI